MSETYSTKDDAIARFVIPQLESWGLLPSDYDLDTIYYRCFSYPAWADGIICDADAMGFWRVVDVSGK